MKDACVIAVYNTLEAAEVAVHVLHRADYPRDQISLLTAAGEQHSVPIEQLSVDDDSLREAAIGAGLGGLVGALAGVSVMAMTGLGVVFLIGPIGGGFVGAITGGLVGALRGWGFHEAQLSYYEHCLKKRQVLLIAEGNPLQVAHANRILLETDNRELHLHAKSDSEAEEVANKK